MDKHSFVAWAFIEPGGQMPMNTYQTKKHAITCLTGCEPWNRRNRYSAWREAKRNGWQVVKVLVSKINSNG